MTDPQDPESRPPDSPPPHGLVEEIKEEIEEVVAHVPQPVRWTISRLRWAVARSIVALVALRVVTAILYVVNRTEWAARELTVLVNQTLASRSDVVLEIHDIKGNPFTGVRLLGPRVRFRD